MRWRNTSETQPLEESKNVAKAQLFGQILEGIETLSIEDQEVLAEILHRRIVERRREELVHDVQMAQQEFQAGQSRPVTPDKLTGELLQ